MPGNPPEQFRFKKGQSGNPGGYQGLPKELKEAAKMSRIEVMQRLVDFLQMNLTNLEDIAKDKARPVMDHWIARICLHGIKHGDSRRLDFMFDRLFGKAIEPPRQVEFNLNAMPMEQVIDLGEEAIRFLKESKE